MNTATAETITDAANAHYLARVNRIVTRTMGDVRYFYLSYVLSVFETLMHYDFVVVNDETIEEMKAAIMYHFCGEVEHEWETEEAFNWWENLKADSFGQYPTTGRWFFKVQPPKGRSV